MAYEAAKTCGLPKDSIHKYAENVAAALALTPGGDLEACLPSLGGRVEYVGAENLSKTNDGSIRVHKIRDFEIFLARDVGPHRCRFTLAHELGHYFLHVPMTKSQQLQAERYGTGLPELEANWFASALLMPEAQVREVYAATGGNISAIAAAFRVSVQAATIRLQELKL